MKYFPTMVLEYVALAVSTAAIAYAIAGSIDASLFTILNHVTQELTR